MSLNNIVIVGAGGIGSALIPLVTRAVMFPAEGERRMGLCIVDGDLYEEKNISRQQFPPTFVGMNKAAAQATKIHAVLGLSVSYIAEYLTEANMEHHLGAIDPRIIFSCADNHRVRYLLTKYVAARLVKDRSEDVLLITGGNDRVDGTVHAFGRRWVSNQGGTGEGIDIGAPIWERHPEINPDNTDGSREHMSCQDMLNMPGGAQTMMANSMAAVLMFSMFRAFIENPKALAGVEDTYFDCLNYQVRIVRQEEQPITL